jgi:hypothetical protein
LDALSACDAGFGDPVEIHCGQSRILHANALGEADALHRASVVELSTNWAENSMRPIAIAQRNKEAGPKIAAIFSIIESCRELDLPIRKYLGEVLPGLAEPASSLWPNSPQQPTAPKRQSGLSPTAQSRQPWCWTDGYIIYPSTFCHLRQISPGKRIYPFSPQEMRA